MLKKFIFFCFLFFSFCTPQKESSTTKNIRTLLLIPILSYAIDSPQSRYALSNVDVSRFVGVWTEWKRIDNDFQGGLRSVQAEYRILSPNQISVKNTGLNPSGQIQSIEGVGTIKYPEFTGYLKVSFSPFFYGDYYILKIDPDYKHALIGGPTGNFLWILTKDITTIANWEKSYTEYAKSIGYDTSVLKSY